MEDSQEISSQQPMVADMVNIDDKDRTIREFKGLVRKQESQNCDIISDFYCLSDNKLVYTCMKLLSQCTHNNKEKNGIKRIKTAL